MRWAGLAVLVVLVGMLAIAQSSGASPPRPNAVHAAAGKRTKHRAPPAGCHETGVFAGRTVRVPVSCPRATGGHCYLISRFDGRSYRQQIDCGPVRKGAGGGSAPGAGATGTSGPSGPSGASGPSGGGGGGGGAPAQNVQWSTAHAAVCDDSSTATSDDAGDFSCDDGSTPFCVDVSAVLLVDPTNQAVLCLPEASIPAAGVCDDASTAGSGGKDVDGTPLCADGDDAYTPADYTIGIDTCDDASNPGAGGSDGAGDPLCADGSYPSAGQ